MIKVIGNLKYKKNIFIIENLYTVIYMDEELFYGIDDIQTRKQLIAILKDYQLFEIWNYYMKHSQSTYNYDYGFDNDGKFIEKYFYFDDSISIYNINAVIMFLLSIKNNSITPEDRHDGTGPA